MHDTTTDIPHKLNHYLTYRSTWNLAPHLSARFYISWEDALWDLIIAKSWRNATITVPEFFCGDVMANMRAHGLRVITYDDQFPDTRQQAKAHTFSFPVADIIVIFHRVGIRNPLIDHIDELPPQTWVIEDCVHQIIDPSKVKIKRKRHFVIDSWRKVLPLQGSMLIGLREDLTYASNTGIRSMWYELKIIFLWILMQILTHAGYAARAQQTMLHGYEVIGDSIYPGRTWSIFVWLRKYINYQKIYTQKYQQMQQYHEILDPLLSYDRRFFTFAHTPDDYPNMRAFPLGIELAYANDVLNILRTSGLLVRFELNDCIWSERQKVIYLPLGPEFDVATIVIQVAQLITKTRGAATQPDLS